MKLDGSRIDIALLLIASIGLALMPFRMELPISLLQLGILLSCFGMIGLILRNVQYITLGSRWIWLPLLVFIFCLLTSSLLNHSSAGLAIASMIPLAYIVGRIVGLRLLIIFPFMIVAISLGYLASTIWNFIFIPNYNIAGIALITGIVVSYYLKAYWAIPIGIIGLAFSRGHEWLLSAVMLATFMFFTIKSSRRYIIYSLGITGAALLILGLLVGFEWHSQIATYFTDWSFNERLPIIMQPLTLFGHGYTANVGGSSIHNTPLIIIEQMGVLGAIIWSYLLLYGIFKTQYKLLFIAWLPFILLDNMLWTQIIIWYFVIIGISTRRLEQYAAIKYNLCATRDMAGIIGTSKRGESENAIQPVQR